MSSGVNEPVDVVACPPVLFHEAIGLALRELAPGQRREIITQLPADRSIASDCATAGLVVALEDGRLIGAAWGQRLPGNTAVFWPPQMIDGGDGRAAERLAGAVVAALDTSGVTMTQVLLPDGESPHRGVLVAAGFEYLCDLLYLSWEAAAVPGVPAGVPDLQFEPFAESQRGRLMELLERSYVGTLDCAALNGRRALGDVVDGYQATGTFRPANWLFVRTQGRDVGVLLLAEYPAARHWELLYMGLVPPVRGRGWGRAIVRHAQSLVSSAGAERMVLAVDAKNLPALAMYRDAGFMAWDKRTVFVRFASPRGGASGIPG